MGLIVDSMLDIFCQLDTLAREKAVFRANLPSNMTDGRKPYDFAADADGAGL